MRNLIVDHTSFENALFEECDIDKLKLDNSSCRGVVFTKCRISYYESTLAKTIGAIGALELLKTCDSFKLYFMNRSINSTQELNQLFSQKSNTMTFADNGNLFEYINIMNYLYNASESRKKELTDSSIPTTKRSKTDIEDGFKVSKYSHYLKTVTQSALEKIIERGEEIDLDNILYSLKLMYFMEIKEYQFLKILSALFDDVRKSTEVNYADFLTMSQIEYYIEEVGSRIFKESYFISLINHDVDWNNSDHREDFQQFVNTLFRFEDNPDDRLISIHEGSIEVNVELISATSFILSSLIIGIKINYNDKNGFSFDFNPRKGIKTYAQLLEKIPTINLFFGIRKIKQEKFDALLNSNPDSLKDYLKRHTVKGTIKHESASKNILKKSSKKNLRNKKKRKLGKKSK